MATLPPISVGGLGNGIDYGQLVAQLVQLRQLPLTRLQGQQQDLQTLQSDYTTLNAKLTSLLGSATALATSTGFARNAAGVSDPTVLSATATASAVPGSYTVQVQQLATAHSITNAAATAVPSPTSSIAPTAATFAFQVGSGAIQTVTVAAGMTVTELADAINAQAAGVAASVVNTGTDANPAYRLVLTATSPGADHAITITTDGTSLDFLNASGTGGTITLQAAQDAVLLFGQPTQSPVTIQRDSNTITDVITGVTLSLKAATTSPVTVTVTRDLSAVKTAIGALVSAYNDVVSYINQNAGYDATTRQGGPLFGEQAARATMQQLRRAVLDPVNGQPATTSLAAVGLTVQKDGTLSLDDAQLDAALNTNYAGVQALFVQGPGSVGIGQQLVNAVNALQDPSAGAIPARQDALRDQATRLGDAIQRQQDQITQYQAMLQRQFAQLDALLRTMQTQMQALTAWTTRG